MADQADFVNLGTVQMANGSELFSGDILVEGTVIPRENGGDFFALEFHSWDLDQGALDFTGISFCKCVLFLNAHMADGYAYILQSMSGSVRNSCLGRL